eukprot:12415087-Karenia_brevis.AAC.1
MTSRPVQSTAPFCLCGWLLDVAAPLPGIRRALLPWDSSRALGPGHTFVQQRFESAILSL